MISNPKRKTQALSKNSLSKTPMEKNKEGEARVKGASPQFRWNS